MPKEIKHLVINKETFRRKLAGAKRNSILFPLSADVQAVYTALLLLEECLEEVVDG